MKEQDPILAQKTAEIEALRAAYALDILLHYGFQQIVAAEAVIRYIEPLQGGETVSAIAPERLLHLRVAVKAHFVRKANDRALADPDSRAELRGSHESRLFIVLGDIFSYIFLAFGKSRHPFFDVGYQI